MYDPENETSCRNQIQARKGRRARRKERLNNFVGTNSASYVSNSQLNDTVGGGGAHTSAVNSGAQISPIANHKSEISGSPVQHRGEIFVGNRTLGDTKLTSQEKGSEEKAGGGTGKVLSSRPQFPFPYKRQLTDKYSAEKINSKKILVNKADPISVISGSRVDSTEDKEKTRLSFPSDFSQVAG